MLLFCNENFFISLIFDKRQKDFQCSMSFSSETKTLAVIWDAFRTFPNCRYCSATEIRRTDNDQTQSITKASKPILLPTLGNSECAHKSFSMSSENLITIYCCQNIFSWPKMISTWMEYIYKTILRYSQYFSIHQRHIRIL